MTYTIDDTARQTIASQIGRMNIFAISGGRCARLTNGIDLPVGYGYRVHVRLTPADEYTVERVFVRGGKVTSHGMETGHYFDTVGDAAYRASCFRNADEDYWPAALDMTTKN